MRDRTRLGSFWVFVVASTAGLTTSAADPDAVERGRVALTASCFLSPAWGLDAYRKLGGIWDVPAPDPDREPAAYDAAVRDRYGLHPAPFPNDGLPMGLRRTKGLESGRPGLQIDCMLCHGGSIGGVSYVGLGNTQLDLQAFLTDMSRADNGRIVPILYTLNTARGTVNAGQISAALLSMRNSDLSPRRFPLLLGAKMPEMDTPAWWLLKRKSTMYYDGRTDARSHRTNMQFLLGELSLDQLKRIEPQFRDIQAYIKSLEPPRYPFPVDRSTAEAGRAVFERTCARCHGTYGPGETYPNKIVPLDAIGTDPARARGLTPRMVAHYNSTWLGADYPGEEEVVGYQAPPLDGVWATAPYLHNGSVPTLYNLLKSSTRPGRFRRPPSTSFDHYDTEHVGWKYEPVPEAQGAQAQAGKFIFDTARFGLSNAGHTFGDKLTEEERLQVIEYLKTL